MRTTWETNWKLHWSTSGNKWRQTIQQHQRIFLERHLLLASSGNWKIDLFVICTYIHTYKEKSWKSEKWAINQNASLFRLPLFFFIKMSIFSASPHIRRVCAISFMFLLLLSFIIVGQSIEEQKQTLGSLNRNAYILRTFIFYPERGNRLVISQSNEQK